MSLMIAAIVSYTIAACPPVQVVNNFNLTEWIRASWYIQRQQVNGFQPRNQLYCVVATYNETLHGKASTVPFFGGEVVTVFNDCDVGGKNQKVSENYTSPSFKRGFGAPLCARQPHADQPAKLSVAPCLLPNALAGNYWVVEAGPSPSNYEYAIVIAGQPTVQNDDGCTTPDTCKGPAETGCGLWFFSRVPAPAPSVSAALTAAAKSKGISTKNLVDVDHSGCRYEGYIIKK